MNIHNGFLSFTTDLPIFSIHGNHDDPTRDSGQEMLAALDLLAVSNLVNYFGRQDEVDNVNVSPVLIEKGDTKIALYGLGSMRDERLNRMWSGQKVKFLQPDEGEWFHIFALHQNRDLGRGVKNCVHESMIPEWMDLVSSQAVFSDAKC
jgi:double-strand break repair protein MRE11